MSNLFWVDSDSSSSSSSSSSFEKDGKSASSWKQLKSNAGTIAILPINTGIPTNVALPTTAINSKSNAKQTTAVAKSIYSLSLDQHTARMSQLAEETLIRRRYQISATVGKFGLKSKSIHHYIESPLLCLATSTRSAIDKHIQQLHAFYQSCETQMNAKVVDAEQARLAINPHKAYVTTFASSETSLRRQHMDDVLPLHSIFNLHGPPSSGKTSWFCNFWEGRLGIPTRIWDLYTSPSMSVVDLCSSIASFFANAIVEGSASGPWFGEKSVTTTSPAATQLVPCMIRNLDHVLDALDDKSQTLFCQTLVKLLMQHASAPTIIDCRQQYAIVYISTSSKSTFAQRDLLKRLGLYRGRIFKFGQCNIPTKIRYLEQLALDGYERPAFLVSQCPTFSSFLSKSRHRMGEQQQGKLSILSLVSNPLFVQHYSPASIPAWMSACDAQLVCSKNRTKTCSSLFSKNEKIANTSLAVVVSQDAQVLLSVLIWPKVFGISQSIHSSLFSRTVSHYGLIKCIKQITKNASNRPCGENLVSEWMPPIRLDSSTLENNLLAKLKHRVFKLLEQLLVTELGLPSAQGKYTHTQALLAGLIQSGGGKSSTPTSTMFILDAAVKCIVSLIWLTCPSTRLENREPLIGWKE